MSTPFWADERGWKEALVVGLVEVGTLAEVSTGSLTARENGRTRAFLSSIVIDSHHYSTYFEKIIHCLWTNPLKSYEVLSKTQLSCVFLHNLKVL